jgi:uncharacterized membrane protein YphA (DoxX/SURF4 family)
MKKIDLLIRGFLAMVFLFSALDKAVHYAGFVNALSSYVLVPRGWAPVLAPSVIAVELLAGAGLLVPGWRRQAALLAGSLLVVFTVALAFNRIYGIRDICGCWFTLTLAKGQGAHIAYNLVLACMAFLQLPGKTHGNRLAPRAVS